MMTQTHEEMWRTIAAIETAAIPPWELFRLDFDAWVLDGMRDHAIGPMTRMLAEIGMRPRSAAELNGVNLRYLFRRLYQMPRGYAWGVRRADDHAKCSSVDTENGTVTYTTVIR